MMETANTLLFAATGIGALAMISGILLLARRAR